MRLRTACGALVLLAWYVPRTCEGQDLLQRRGEAGLRIPAPVPVTVMVAGELPDEYATFDAVVMRRVGRPDVIRLRESRMTVLALDSAMRLLLESRLDLGLAPDGFPPDGARELVLGVHSNDPSEAAWLWHYSSKIQAVLERLKAAPVQQQNEAGEVHITTVRPPELGQWLVPKHRTQPDTALGRRVQARSLPN